MRFSFKKEFPHFLLLLLIFSSCYAFSSFLPIKSYPTNNLLKIGNFSQKEKVTLVSSPVVYPKEKNALVLFRGVPHSAYSDCFFLSAMTIQQEKERSLNHFLGLPDMPVSVLSFRPTSMSCHGKEQKIDGVVYPLSNSIPPKTGNEFIIGFSVIPSGDHKPHA